MSKFIIAILFILSFPLSSLMAQQESIQSIYGIYQINSDAQPKTPATTKIGFYKKYISKQISAQCEFASTCSAFMAEAMLKVGPLKGFLQGIDRLSRCGASDATYTYLPALKSSTTHDLIDEIHFYE